MKKYTKPNDNQNRIIMPLDDNGVSMLDEFLKYIKTPEHQIERLMKDILIMLDSRNLIVYKEDNLFDDCINKTASFGINNSVENLKELLCRQYKIDPSLLESKTRKTEVVKIKKMVFLMLYCTTKLSLASIGSSFNHGGDHANVLHHIREIKNQLEVDKYYRLEVSTIARDFNFLYEMIRKLDIPVLWAIDNGMLYPNEAIENKMLNKLEFIELKKMLQDADSTI